MSSAAVVIGALRVNNALKGLIRAFCAICTLYFCKVMEPHYLNATTGGAGLGMGVVGGGWSPLWSGLQCMKGKVQSSPFSASIFPKLHPFTAGWKEFFSHSGPCWVRPATFSTKLICYSNNKFSDQPAHIHSFWSGSLPFLCTFYSTQCL